MALALFVTRRTGSASDLGLVLAAQAAAFALLVLLGGVWDDHLPRRRIMIGADLARAALHLTLAVLILTGRLRLWHGSRSRPRWAAPRRSSPPPSVGCCYRRPCPRS